MDEHKDFNIADKYDFDEFDTDKASTGKKRGSGRSGANLTSKSKNSKRDNYNAPDYGDNFTSMGDKKSSEGTEHYSYSLVDDSDEAYYSKDNSAPPGRLKYAPKKKNKSNNKAIALVFISIAIVCLVIAIIFILTRCTDDIKTTISTTAPTSYTKVVTVQDNTEQATYQQAVTQEVIPSSSAVVVETEVVTQPQIESEVTENPEVSDYESDNNNLNENTSSTTNQDDDEYPEIEDLF